MTQEQNQSDPLPRMRLHAIRQIVLKLLRFLRLDQPSAGSNPPKKAQLIRKAGKLRPGTSWLETGTLDRYNVDSLRSDFCKNHHLGII